MFFTKREKINIQEARHCFDVQQKTLIEKGYPQLLGMSLEEFKSQTEKVFKVLQQKAGEYLFIKKGTVPLLLVVNTGDLAKKIEIIKGHTELDLGKIKKEAQHIESSFYILLDVEDGKNMVATSPKDALKKFEKGKRFALTINESVALLTHYPHLLKNNYLISAGSFYTKEQEILPLLWLLDEHGNPELHYAWFHIAHGSYGVGSYAIKIT